MKRKGIKSLCITGALFLFVINVYIVVVDIFYHRWLWAADGIYIIIIMTTAFILGLLFFILINFLYFNKKHQIISKKRLRPTLIMTPLLAAFLLFGSRLLIRNQYKNSHIFTTERWLNTPPDGRWHLMTSFTKQYEIIGKSYDEVFSLLGEPDNKTATSCSYYIGYGRQFINIDPYFYYITFDETFLVTSADIYQS